MSGDEDKDVIDLDDDEEDNQFARELEGTFDDKDDDIILDKMEGLFF